MTRSFSAVRLAAVALTILVSTPMPATAITAPTHDIATCAALNTLGANASSAADTINLTADLDCTGVTFLPMFTAGYSGTFEGNGHSISHLTINRPSTTGQVGLFSRVDGGTIRHLVLTSGTVTGGTVTGALIGQANHVTVSDVTSAVNVTSSESSIGGLFGALLTFDGDSLVEDVTVTGAVTVTTSTFFGSNQDVGGLAGYITLSYGDVTIRRTAHTGSITSVGNHIGGLAGSLAFGGQTAPLSALIEDSYTSGTINAPTTSNVGASVGGLFGIADAVANGAPTSINLTRVYSTATIHANYFVGGLVGGGRVLGTGATFAITDSFAAGSVIGNSSTGSLVGVNGTSLPEVLESAGNYYDGPGTGQSACTTNTALTGDCTRIDTSATPGYFKGNRTNAPFTHWDFAGTWRTNAGGYPTLIPADDGDNISKAEEAAAPNSGDANGDGIPDAAQPNVAGFINPVTNQYAAVVVSSPCTIAAASAVAESSLSTADAGYDYPNGLINFTANCGTPGFTASVSALFYGGVVTTPRKYNPTTHGYMSIPSPSIDTVLAQTFIGGQSVALISYLVTDGGPYDADGTANGVIVDPVGFGQNVVGVPNTGLGSLSRR
jgi:hypothetical protein